MKTLNKLLTYNFGRVEFCFLTSPFSHEFSQLRNNEAVVYTFHNKLHEFLFYNKKTKHLFHLKG